MRLLSVKSNLQTPNYIYQDANVYFEGVLSPARIKMVASPTNNCQMASIGPIVALLSLLENQTDEVKAFEIKEVLADFYKIGWRPNILMVDVNKEWIRDVKVCFKNIISETPYISTNGSEMCIFLVNVFEIFETVSITRMEHHFRNSVH